MKKRNLELDLTLFREKIDAIFDLSELEQDLY